MIDTRSFLAPDLFSQHVVVPRQGILMVWNVTWEN
jgi:hypothetical protein